MDSEAITRALADQSRTIRIVHMIETISKYSQVKRKYFRNWSRASRRNPIEMDTAVDKIRHIQKFPKHSFIEAPIGEEEEESTLGDIVKDEKSDFRSNRGSRTFKR